MYNIRLFTYVQVGAAFSKNRTMLVRADNSFENLATSFTKPQLESQFKIK